MAEIEAIDTSKGTEKSQTPGAARDITGVGAFA
jgi:hypothetical protein